MKISIVFNGPLTQAPLTDNLKWWVKKEKGLDLYGHQLECRNTSNGSIIKMTITLMVTEEEESLLERLEILEFARRFFGKVTVFVTEFKEFQGSMRTITLVLE